MTSPGRKRLSEAAKKTRAFLKRRITFHSKAASKPKQFKDLVSWHKQRAAKLAKIKEGLFPKPGKK